MRTWPGLAAIGAGLIHLGSAPSTPPAVLTVLVLVGAAELLWGVAALARPLPPAPLRTLAGLGVVLLLTVEALLLPPAAAHSGTVVSFGLAPGAVLGAGALDVVLAGLLAASIGLGRRATGPGRPLPFLLSAGAAAAVVAMVTTSSLAGTAVGGGMEMH